MPFSIMKKNEKFIGTCEAYTYDGLGVVHHQDFVFFVPRLLAGEKAELAITKLKKRYGYARIVQLLETSSHRREPICSVAKTCGGCQLLHMDESEQKIFKEDKVRGCFRMNANIEVDVLPIITTDHQTAYRNKVQVPIQVHQNQTLMGFYKTHSNEIVEYDYCHMQTPLSNDITQAIKQLLIEKDCASSVKHILVKHAHQTGEVMICLIIRNANKKIKDIIEPLLEDYPMIQSIVTIENKRDDNVILDGKETLLYGSRTIKEELLGYTFRIGAKSFYQINPYATEKLYQTVQEFAQLTGDDVLVDLYCGTGTIGIIMAKHCKKVVGIEIVKEAIDDARINAQENGIDNISFFVADAGNGANQLLKDQIQPSVVIIDPPRKGCSKDTLEAIIKMNPDRIVYVSCDPATLARDCDILKEYYRIEKIQPCDMFPNTTHVETVILLSLAEC